MYFCVTSLYQSVVMEGPKRKRHASEPAVNTNVKRQRILLTLDTKVLLIKDSENVGINQTDLSKKYGIGRSSVGDILKRKEFYMEQYTKSTNTKAQRFNSPSKFGELNNALYEWFKQARAKNMPVTCPRLQEKATVYAT